MTSQFPDPSDEVVTLGGGAQFYQAPSGASVQAGSGSDTVEAGAGDVTVTGGSGQLTSVGGSLSGGAAGHSVLISQGVDLGFSGAVVYDVVSSLPGGFTGIRGFRPGTDKIELFGYQPSAVTASTAGGTTAIHFLDGKVINLPGVTSLGSSLVFG